MMTPTHTSFTQDIFPPDHPWRKGDTIRIELPPLYMPWPPSTAPLGRSADERSLAWADRYGLLATDELRNHADLGAGDFSSRISIERQWSEPFQIMSDMVLFGFLIDDYFDGAVTVDQTAGGLAAGVRIGHDWLHLMKDPESALINNLGVYGNAARDIARRTHALGNFPYLLRLIRDLREWFIASIRQNANLDEGRRLPDLDGIIEHVHEISGHGFFSGFFPYLTPEPVPLEILDSRDMRDLVELMATICEIYNHMASLGKELWLSEHYPLHWDATTLSTIAHLAYAEGISLDEALLKVSWVHDTLVGQFERLYAGMADHADDNTLYYMRTVAATIRGNFDWHPNARRYTNPDGKRPEAITIMATTHNNIPVDHGPPVASVARWWRP